MRAKKAENFSSGKAERKVRNIAKFGVVKFEFKQKKLRKVNEKKQTAKQQCIDSVVNGYGHKLKTS